jgi:hypothetical protein
LTQIQDSYVKIRATMWFSIPTHRDIPEGKSAYNKIPAHALFTIAKLCEIAMEIAKISQNWWTDEENVVNVMEFYLAIKKNEIFVFHK